jgi:3-oxoacyl-[acyl-carrier protein] reductase
VNELKGRVALVTGSSRGIGRAIALALAEAGVDIVLNFLRRAADAQAVELQIRQLERRCVTIKADVSSSSDVEQLVRSSEDQLGPVDILVNNAGIARPQPIEEITERDWDEVITANLKSCFLVTQAVLPGMRARKWGRVVNLSSVAAQVGGIVGPHYAASKAGMLGLTHYYAQRLAKEGITVNAIAPGACGDRDGYIESQREAGPPSDRQIRIDRGSRRGGCNARQKRVHDRPDDQRQRRLVHELILDSAAEERATALPMPIGYSLAMVLCV